MSDAMQQQNPARRGGSGSRRHAREMIIQALYQSEIGQEEIYRAVEQLQELPANAKADLEYFSRCALAISRRLAELDDWIARYAEKWALERVAVTERCILRLGIYELLSEQDIPLRVVINEALELAKVFGGKGARRFVNGVLDKVGAAVRPQEAAMARQAKPHAGEPGRA